MDQVNQDGSCEIMALKVLALPEIFKNACKCSRESACNPVDLVQIHVGPLAPNRDL